MADLAASCPFGSLRAAGLSRRALWKFCLDTKVTDAGIIEYHDEGWIAVTSWAPWFLLCALLSAGFFPVAVVLLVDGGVAGIQFFAVGAAPVVALLVLAVLASRHRRVRRVLRLDLGRGTVVLQTLRGRSLVSEVRAGLDDVVVQHVTLWYEHRLAACESVAEAVVLRAPGIDLVLGADTPRRGIEHCVAGLPRELGGRYVGYCGVLRV